MPIILDTRDPGFETAFAALLAAKRESAADVDAAVAAIIADVASRGDAALVEYTSRFDRLKLTAAGLRLTRDEIAAGADAAPAETVDALHFAAERIESFHRRQLPAPVDYVDDAGVRLGSVGRPGVDAESDEGLPVLLRQPAAQHRGQLGVGPGVLRVPEVAVPRAPLASLDGEHRAVAVPRGD